MNDVFLLGAGASKEYVGVKGPFFCDPDFFQVVKELWGGWLRHGVLELPGFRIDNRPEHYDGERWDWPQLRAALDRMPTRSISRTVDRSCTMGVDTGKELHVVISRRIDSKGDDKKREILYIGTAQGYDELDSLMERFKISRCVIDALPEIHATRGFAGRHRGRVWLNYFNENQKGSAKWDKEQHIVQVNRTEALDAAKKGIRDGAVVLPRRLSLVEEFAEHLASDAKKLIEDEETGAKSYRYIRTGTNHYSLAFTYDWIASERERRRSSAWVSHELRPEDRPIMSGFPQKF